MSHVRTIAGDGVFGVIQDVPADAGLYRMIIDRIGDAEPLGLITHLALERPEGGLRYVDVWEDEAQWKAWMDDVVEPAVGDVLGGLGFPHDHSLVHTEIVRVVDAWVPGRAPSTR